MKLKTLKKKIRRLQTRLQEGPKKLAKLKGKLAALVKANAARAKKKSPKQKPNLTAKSQVKADANGSAPKKVKRKLNLSPERREQLAAAMRARWAAKRAAQATPPDGSASNDFTIGQVPQPP
jgi:hypothetical protein